MTKEGCNVQKSNCPFTSTPLTLTPTVGARLFVTPCGFNGKLFGICIFRSPLGETPVFNSVGTSNQPLPWVLLESQEDLDAHT